jgi:hypothetical protein
MTTPVSCEKRLKTCQEELNIISEQLQECQSKIVEYDPERIRMLEGMKELRDDTILQNAALVEEKRILEQRNKKLEKHTIDLKQQYDELRNQYSLLFKQTRPVKTPAHTPVTASRFVVEDVPLHAPTSRFEISDAPFGKKNKNKNKKKKRYSHRHNIHRKQSIKK